MRAQTAEIKWNKKGTMALVITQTDVDATGKSYYGETCVHLLGTDGSAQNVKPFLEKEGPIYQCVWSPTGDKFVAVYGSMPASATLFNAKLEKLVEFPPAHRNTAFFSPNGHILAIGGFGNLQGNIDLWDVKRGKLMATFQAPCSAQYQWSPCSNYILTAILTPRLRQDNGWKVWGVDGKMIFEQAHDELYQADWRPTPPNRYPDIPPKREQSMNKAAAQPAPAPARYRPPGARNTPSPVEVKAQPMVAKKFDPQQKNYPIGGVPLNSKNAAKNKKRREKKKRLQEGSSDSQPQTQQPAKEQTPSPATSQPDNEDNPNAKRIKMLNKKLRQIEQLREQQSSGKTLNEQQLAKLASEKEIKAEIHQLGGK